MLRPIKIDSLRGVSIKSFRVRAKAGKNYSDYSNTAGATAKK